MHGYRTLPRSCCPLTFVASFAAAFALGCAEPEDQPRAADCTGQVALTDLSATAWLDTIKADGTGLTTTRTAAGGDLDWYYGMGYVKNDSGTTITLRLTRADSSGNTGISFVDTLANGESLWAHVGNGFDSFEVEAWTGTVDLTMDPLAAPDASSTVMLNHSVSHVQLDDNGLIEKYTYTKPGSSGEPNPYVRHYVRWGDVDKIHVTPYDIASSKSIWVASTSNGEGKCVPDWTVTWTEMGTKIELPLTKDAATAAVLEGETVVALGLFEPGTTPREVLSDTAYALIEPSQNYIKIGDAFPGQVRVEHFADDCSDHVPVTVPMLADRKDTVGTVEFINCTDDPITFYPKEGPNSSMSLFELEPQGSDGDRQTHGGCDNNVLEVLTWVEGGDPTMMIKKKPEGEAGCP